MKFLEKSLVPLTLFFIALAYAFFFWFLVGAKPRENVASVCIYEVTINQLINHVNIGWTPEVCTGLDVRLPEDHDKLTHSPFNPVCPVFSVQMWPGFDLPVLDYARDCDLNFLPEERRAVIGHALEEEG